MSGPKPHHKGSGSKANAPGGFDWSEEFINQYAYDRLGDKLSKPQRPNTTHVALGMIEKKVLFQNRNSDLYLQVSSYLYIHPSIHSTDSPSVNH